MNRGQVPVSQARIPSSGGSNPSRHSSRFLQGISSLWSSMTSCFPFGERRSALNQGALNQGRRTVISQDNDYEDVDISHSQDNDYEDVDISHSQDSDYEDINIPNDDTYDDIGGFSVGTQVGQSGLSREGPPEVNRDRKPRVQLSGVKTQSQILEDREQCAEAYGAVGLNRGVVPSQAEVEEVTYAKVMKKKRE